MQDGANLACYNFAMQTALTRLDETIIDGLNQHGYIIIDEYLSINVIASLAQLASVKFNQKAMASAGTGKQAKTNANIRGDSIHWLDEESTEPAVQEYFSNMQYLKGLLNQHFYMGLASLETHLAIYPVGAVYQKHLDQFSAGRPQQFNTRKLSSILYLNQDWLDSDGGQLRLYVNEDKWLDIMPVGGRLVLFLSDQFWHEVLPAKRERLSLTGWFRTREFQPI